jgi:GNAT superfamily N-acetyltransferase
MDLILEQLERVPAASLEPVMAEEATHWLGTLSWDFASTHEFILSYIRMHALPGLVVLDGRKPVGYAYLVVDGQRAIVGALYVLRKYWGQGIEQLLVERILSGLTRNEAIKRIEAQIVVFSGAPVEEAFRAAGFQVFRRNFLTLSMKEWQGGKEKSPGYRLADWRDSYVPEAARVVFDSYRGGIDARFSTSFSYLDKCEDFVHNLVHRSGCGDFLPRITTVGFAPDSRLAGVVLATRLSDGMGHLPQISVGLDHHGKGLGNWLVDESLRRFRDSGYGAVSLTVTELNVKADTWYRRLGFAQTFSFNAYLWERR